MTMLGVLAMVCCVLWSLIAACSIGHCIGCNRRAFEGSTRVKPVVNGRKLKKLSVDAIPPGTYRIHMLPKPFFFWFLNVKVIQHGLVRSGRNRFLSLFWWAYFWVQQADGCVLLNYMPSRWPFRNIRDYVYAREDGSLFGYFRYLIFGKEITLGCFLMERED